MIQKSQKLLLGLYSIHQWSGCRRQGNAGEPFFVGDRQSPRACPDKPTPIYPEAKRRANAKSLSSR
jgi:hypothetical protein